MHPKFSIIINCYNGEKHLKEAIDSIFSQTCEDWEIVFFDNCSTDSSKDITLSYGDKVKYYKSNENIPLGHARKEALTYCLGDWICFLDCDDVWLPEKLELQNRVLKDCDYVLCYGGVEEISENGTHISNNVPSYKSGFIFSELLAQYDINIVTPAIKRSFLIDNDLTFDETITASEEYNLFMRIASIGKVAVINSVLGKYRVYEKSLTNQKMDKWAYERRYTLDSIIESNLKLKEHFNNEFKLAYDRADYYEAVYLMGVKNRKSARKILKKLSEENRVYLLLYISSKIPLLWKFLHNRKVKMYISGLLR